MSNFIVRTIQKRILKRIINNRERSYISLHDAKSVAFVIEVNDTQSASQAISILEKRAFKPFNISYQGIAVESSKKSVDTSFLIANTHITILSDKELNYRNIQNHPHLTSFLEERYDILFDLSTNGSFQVEYIVKKANASLIVGFDPQKQKLYDLLFHSSSSDESSSDISTLVAKAIEYLISIKSN